MDIIVCLILFILAYWFAPTIGAALSTLQIAYPGLLLMAIAFIFTIVMFIICSKEIRNERNKGDNGSQAGIKILYLCEYGSVGLFLISAIRALWLNYS